MVFHIDREIHDFAVLTRVQGELDLSVVDEVRQAFTTALALTTPPFPLVIDLEGVEFLSSCGLNELLAIDQLARGRGVPLRVVAVRREVLRPLALTGLLEVLDIRSSVEDGLSAAAHSAVAAEHA